MSASSSATPRTRSRSRVATESDLGVRCRGRSSRPATEGRPRGAAGPAHPAMFVSGGSSFRLVTTSSSSSSLSTAWPASRSSTVSTAKSSSGGGPATATAPDERGEVGVARRRIGGGIEEGCEVRTLEAAGKHARAAVGEHEAQRCRAFGAGVEANQHPRVRRLRQLGQPVCQGRVGEQLLHVDERLERGCDELLEIADPIIRVEGLVSDDDGEQARLLVGQAGCDDDALTSIRAGLRLRDLGAVQLSEVDEREASLLRAAIRLRARRACRAGTRLPHGEQGGARAARVSGRRRAHAPGSRARHPERRRAVRPVAPARRHRELAPACARARPEDLGVVRRPEQLGPCRDEGPGLEGIGGRCAGRFRRRRGRLVSGRGFGPAARSESERNRQMDETEGGRRAPHVDTLGPADCRSGATTSEGAAASRPNASVSSTAARPAVLTGILRANDPEERRRRRVGRWPGAEEA